MERRIFVPPAIWLVAAIATAMLQASAAQTQEFSQILRGYQIAPVQLNLKAKDWALVGLGSYLVNTTGCNDCHTWPNWADGHNPYLPNQKLEQINTQGYMAGGRPFGADVVNPKIQVVSANITPDKNGMPAGLTRSQFLHLMQTGDDPDDPTRKLKIMPWPLYRWKTDLDLIAIYEYLRAIPSIPAD